ncbi:ROK family transcriptional regulator [Streptomyces sp. NPDC047028]|uniref:ROK family transcriptional regulator n=1 Tax=Streptomyces sp. NPDC047028 TaxID=3155793 RepID=UPI0033D9D6D1
MNGGGAARTFDVSRQNVAFIVRAVLEGGPLPRARISERTGLSAAAVTRLSARLVQAGLLRELPSVLGAADAGRPRVPLDLDVATRLTVGVHVGLLRTSVGLVNLRGNVVARTVLPHGSTDPEVMADQAVSGVEELIAAEAKGRTVLGVGASMGGWIDTDGGRVVEHAALGWRDVPFRDLLARRLDVPLLFDDTVRGMAVAECTFGAGTSVHSVAQLFVGNVVGAAIMIDRRVHRGPRSAAGWLTHLPLYGATGGACTCGRRGCVQSVVSDAGMLDRARERGVAAPGEQLEDLIDRSRGGDKAAARVLRERSRHVGQVAALLLDVINPDIVVLAGGPLATPEHLPAAQRELGKWSRLEAGAAPRLVPSALGEHAQVLASAAVFLEAYFADPLSYEDTDAILQGPPG